MTRAQSGPRSQARPPGTQGGADKSHRCWGAAEVPSVKLLVSTLSSKSSKRRHQRVMVTKVPSSSCVWSENIWIIYQPRRSAFKIKIICTDCTAKLNQAFGFRLPLIDYSSTTSLWSLACSINDRKFKLKIVVNTGNLNSAAFPVLLMEKFSQVHS